MHILKIAYLFTTAVYNGRIPSTQWSNPNRHTSLIFNPYKVKLCHYRHLPVSERMPDQRIIKIPIVT